MAFPYNEVPASKLLSSYHILPSNNHLRLRSP